MIMGGIDCATEFPHSIHQSGGRVMPSLRVGNTGGIMVGVNSRWRYPTQFSRVGTSWGSLWWH